MTLLDVVREEAAPPEAAVAFHSAAEPGESRLQETAAAHAVWRKCLHDSRATMTPKHVLMDDFLILSLGVVSRRPKSSRRESPLSHQSPRYVPPDYAAAARSSLDHSSWSTSIVSKDYPGRRRHQDAGGCRVVCQRFAHRVSHFLLLLGILAQRRPQRLNLERQRQGLLESPLPTITSKGSIVTDPKPAFCIRERTRSASSNANGPGAKGSTGGGGGRSGSAALSGASIQTFS